MPDISNSYIYGRGRINLKNEADFGFDRDWELSKEGSLWIKIFNIWILGIIRAGSKKRTGVRFFAGILLSAKRT